MLRFRNRVALLDVRSDEFLNTLVQLGGYCTVGQAKSLGIANSDTRVLAHLRVFEQNGFLRKVSAYPIVYQVTKAATRLGAMDRRARRAHSYRTVLNRLLAVDFYLEALDWEAEFLLDHATKIATLTEQGCPMHVIPHRAGRPYLWEEFFLRVSNDTITIALIDDQQRSPWSQARTLVERYSPVLPFFRPHSGLQIVHGSEARQRSYERALRRLDGRLPQAGTLTLVELHQVEPSVKFFAQTDPEISHPLATVPRRERPQPVVYGQT